MKVTDKIEITNEDNMLLMARYPDNYFDLAIVDPPYGIGEDGRKGVRTSPSSILLKIYLIKTHLVGLFGIKKTKALILLIASLLGQI